METSNKDARCFLRFLSSVLYHNIWFILYHLVLSPLKIKNNSKDFSNKFHKPWKFFESNQFEISQFFIAIKCSFVGARFFSYLKKCLEVHTVDTLLFCYRCWFLLRTFFFSIIKNYEKQRSIICNSKTACSHFEQHFRIFIIFIYNQLLVDLLIECLSV